MPDLVGVVGTPQDVIRDHPAIRKVNIFFKLDGYDLGVDLHNDAHQPTTNTFVLLVIVIAKNFHTIADPICVFAVRCICKVEICQFCLLN
jgi:hypothetical protein